MPIDKPTRRPTKRDDSINVKGIFERIECGGRISLQQLCVVAQVGLTTLYQAIHSGKLAVVKVGRFTFVEADAARAYLRGEAMPRGAKGADISSADNPGKRAAAAAIAARHAERAR